ncbi:hypothetical protein [Parvularcula sp. IMCC14364]|uniref:hypothetical protein n=1 Tax=Parvularcula sp. IMCC14364 TaxID=3067902 RepID=UPI0027429447|nr:hypothetical protein [Parvularcula sp. IMCC14364]
MLEWLKTFLPEPVLLHGLMGMHTLIVAFALVAGPYIAWKAIRAERSLWLYLALAFPPLVCLGRIANGRECILQSWARELRHIEHGWARDIYLLPESWALSVVLVAGALYFCGCAIWVSQRGAEKEQIF